MPCPYCSSPHGRSAITAAGRNITECTTCGRVISEHLTLPHHLFHLRANETSLPLATSDLTKYAATDASAAVDNEEDPFLPTGFITTFSTWSLEQYPVMARSTVSFAGHLAELERVLETTTSTGGAGNGAGVVVDNLRAYLQIIDVASILGIENDISEHAFQLFRDCSTATCLRNRSVEALATAALLRAIREAAEPRTLQELSMASNLPQKEIGKYMKILGEALQLSQPMNSNSISVHMPRFCNLLQLNKSAQELATHIGDVVVNKCFCTRRNPISISAAAIYLACQLEDKRKTQAEICKVTGLTEVTLRKVYKELLENWDDLLPSNYHPVVPPEKAFPSAIVASGRSSSSSSYKNDLIEATCSERDKNAELKPSRDMFNLPPGQTKGKDSVESNDHLRRSYSQPPSFWKSQVALLCSHMNVKGHETTNQAVSDARNMEIDADVIRPDSSSLRQVQFPSVSNKGSSQWPFRPSMASPLSSSPVQIGQQMKMGDSVVEEGAMQHDLNEKFSQ